MTFRVVCYSVVSTHFTCDWSLLKIKIIKNQNFWEFFRSIIIFFWMATTSFINLCGSDLQKIVYINYFLCLSLPPLFSSFMHIFHHPQTFLNLCFYIIFLFPSTNVTYKHFFSWRDTPDRDFNLKKRWKGFKFSLPNGNSCL